MRSYNEDDKDDKKELSLLNPDKWMVDLLKRNPEYVYWGPHEDYMWTKESGWDSPIVVDSWKEFKWELDELNELVNFYFEIERESIKCPECSGTGYHPDCMWISESFYHHTSPFCSLTQREILIKKGLAEKFGCDTEDRMVRKSFPSEETFAKYDPGFKKFCENMKNGKGYWGEDIDSDDEKALSDAGRGWNSPFGHDCINIHVMVEAKCKKWGIPRTCHGCNGRGSVFTTEKAHVQLVLWMIHPRKGASRGVEIKLIEKKDVPAVLKYLKNAAKRNADRFSKLD